MTTPAQIEELKTLVEPGKVLTDADSLEAYGKDWTKHFAPAPSAIAFPKSIEQVQAIVRWANAHRIALVPSGGRTGLSAAAVAANGVDLVNKDDRGAVLLCLLKEVAHSRRANANEHLDKVGATDREERHSGLASDGASEQGLSGSGRSVEQNALGDLRAHRLELGRVLEELLDSLHNEVVNRKIPLVGGFLETLVYFLRKPNPGRKPLLLGHELHASNYSTVSQDARSVRAMCARAWTCCHIGPPSQHDATDSNPPIPGN